MDPTSREDLSALMDGELAAEPTRFLMRRLEHDPELSAAWSRWHLIRACLASDPARMSAPGADQDFASRVAASVAADQAPRRRHRQWAQYVGGSALAAGVAVAALMLNTPVARVGASAAVAQSRPAASAVAVAEVSHAKGSATIPTAPAWLLPRQPTVLDAQPASANVVYGTGLMQPEYLRRAAFDRDAVRSFQARSFTPPFSIVVLPQRASVGGVAAGH